MKAPINPLKTHFRKSFFSHVEKKTGLRVTKFHTTLPSKLKSSLVNLFILLPVKYYLRQMHLSRVKTENPAARIVFFNFSIDDFIANISLYALSWPKLNF